MQTFHMTPEAAIAVVRERRPGSVQNTRQVRFVHAYAEYVGRLRLSFVIPPLDKEQALFTISDFIARQRRYLHGAHRGGCASAEEAWWGLTGDRGVRARSQARNSNCCDRCPRSLSSFATAWLRTPPPPRTPPRSPHRSLSSGAPNSPPSPPPSASLTSAVACRSPDWDHKCEEDLRQLKRRVNGDDWYGLDAVDIRFRAQLLLDWFDTLAVRAALPWGS